MESLKKKFRSLAKKASETSESGNSSTENEEEGEDDLTDNEDAVSDSCSDDAEGFLAEEFDYMADVVKLLEDHAEANMDNSLALNRKLQDMLEALRNKIMTLINKCREIYLENQQKLANPSTAVSHLKGIGRCGRPFFKDKDGRHCPPNEDYIYRSEVEHEFFPSDLELFPHSTWTAKDKVGILQGIKEQAIDYIERKNSYEEKLQTSRKTPLSKNVKLHTLKIEKLLDKVDSDFAIDWNQISVYNLGSRHTANSCLASWNAYLKPEINRDEWTDEENIKLNELVKKYEFQDWIAIASEMPGRSDYQCFVQYQTVVSIKMRKDKCERWTTEEDDLLLSLVEKYRMGNVIRWNPICSQFPNRTKQQCFARWKYSINPNISRAQFTPVEDCIILAAVEEFGENFNYFPKDLFPNRTVVQIRNRYNNSIKSRGTIRYWTPEDDQLLLDLIAQHGEHDWTKIADSMVGHTRTSCRTRYLTISKFFKDNPNATIQDIPRKKRISRSTVTKNNWVETITGLGESKTKAEPSIKKELYRSKLRNNELQWYNFLKYSYDYEFGKGYSLVPKTLASLELVRYNFECKLSMPVVLHGQYSKGFVPVSLQKLIRLHDQGDASLVFEKPDVGYRLPPSFSTLLAFRGLCIQVSFEDKQGLSKIELPDNVLEARKMFRRRLVSLLYKTTLLSRLEPNTSVQQNSFEVIYDANTEMGKIAGINLAELKVAQTKKIAQNLLIAQQKADKNRSYREKNKKEISKPNTNDNKRNLGTQKNNKPSHKSNLNKEANIEEKNVPESTLKPKTYGKKQKSFQQPEGLVIDCPPSTSLRQTETMSMKLEPFFHPQEESFPVYENLEVSEFVNIALQNANRKRKHEESLLVLEESTVESPATSKIIKREYE